MVGDGDIWIWGCRGDLFGGDTEITVGACRFILKRSVLRSINILRPERTVTGILLTEVQLLNDAT
jgi:hypothetical protein